MSKKNNQTKQPVKPKQSPPNVSQKVSHSYRLNPLDWVFATWYYSWFKWKGHKELTTPVKEADRAYARWSRLISFRGALNHSPDRCLVSNLLGFLVALPFAYFFRVYPLFEKCQYVAPAISVVIWFVLTSWGNTTETYYFTRNKVHQINIVLFHREPPFWLCVLCGLISTMIFILSCFGWVIVCFILAIITERGWHSALP